MSMGGHSWTNPLASYPFSNNRGQPTHSIFRPDTKEVAETDILEPYCLVIVNVLAAAGTELKPNDSCYRWDTTTGEVIWDYGDFQIASGLALSLSKRIVGAFERIGY